ncbi:MAG: hypothetical protein ABIJ21_01320 [Nanoarchaeota archaeon]
MNRGHIAIILIITALIISSCKLAPKESTRIIKCPDGRFVYNLTECNLPEEENITNTTSIPPPQNITQNQTTEPERNFSTLRRKENDTEIVKTDGIVPNLNGWSIAEIVEGMSSYNKNFIAIYLTVVSYDPTAKTYALGTGQYKEDPFWAARAPYSGKTKEYNINNFRVSLTQTPYEFYDMVESKHNDSKFKIVYPEQWAAWDSINCKKISSCRNIEAIECTNGNHTLYMWTHNTPGQGYTELTNYNMQAVDDKRETLTTFEKFYCTPV